MQMNKEQIAKTVVAHGAAITAMNMITTVFLHRGETHGLIEVSKPVREVARFGTWLLSGMKPREWVGVHLRHHAETDLPGDPHSPVQNGRFGVAKVFVGNGLHYYKRAAKELTPDDYPVHLRPDAKDKLLYDKGMIGQVALFGLFTLMHRGNPKKGAISLAAHSLLVHDTLALSGGGLVNSVLHRGKGNLLSTLVSEPVPFDDGTFTINAGPVATTLTLGEGSHDNHHKYPDSLRFNDNPWLDIGGVAAQGLIRIGLAQPGTGPRE
jgi:stearoyl-CoA desaturase (delta-9 desaturase)